jgi:hypothetical protein
LLVTNKPAEFEKETVEIQDFTKMTQRSSIGTYENISQINEQKPKDHHMQLAGLGNTHLYFNQLCPKISLYTIVRTHRLFSQGLG